MCLITAQEQRDPGTHAGPLRRGALPPQVAGQLGAPSAPQREVGSGSGVGGSGRGLSGGGNAAEEYCTPRPGWPHVPSATAARVHGGALGWGLLRPAACKPGVIMAGDSAESPGHGIQPRRRNRGGDGEEDADQCFCAASRAFFSAAALSHICPDVPAPSQCAAPWSTGCG